MENASGWSVYRLDNRYPDITWRGLWQPLWYENYPEPAYVWQSSSAEESYQAKFSLIPIIFGTLKAAVYAMLFAVPLALAGPFTLRILCLRGCGESLNRPLR